MSKERRCPRSSGLLVGSATVLCLMMACSAGNQVPTCKTSPRGSGLEEEICIPHSLFRMGHAALVSSQATPVIGYVAPPKNDWVVAHEVSLPSFYLDKYEVTWGRYRKCVDAGICSTGGIDLMPSTKEALRDPRLANRPAYNITYEQALTFCLWEGKRLPTEAEWERAARGPHETDYPWGNAPPNKALLAATTYYGPDVGSEMPDPVGSYAQDKSPEGVFDLFGSVKEWTADWYDFSYYRHSLQLAPKGPPASRTRVVRGDRWNRAGGDAWDTDKAGAPVWFRDHLKGGAGAGFRCARSDEAQDDTHERGGNYSHLVWHARPARSSR